MKKLSMLLAAALLVCGAAWTCAGPALALETTVETVESSGSAAGTVTLSVSADGPTSAGEIKLTYDSEVLTYVSTQVETEMYSVHAETGSVLVVYSNLEAMDGTLVVFTFSCADTGKTETVVTVEGQTYGSSDTAQTGTEDVTVVLKKSSGGGGGTGGSGTGGGGTGGGGGFGGGSAVVPGGTGSGNETKPDEHVCRASGYDDLDVKAWYHEAVDYVLENGIMEGTGEKTFEPEGATTRAAFVTVLGRMTGIDKTAYASSGFSDVEAGSWYGPYVQWAYESGITTGVTQDLFAPDKAMSRQEMVTFLARYAKLRGADLSMGAAASLDAFSDGKDVDGWAREAFLWAVGNKIVDGTGAGLEPAAACNRAQIAQVVMKYAGAFIDGTEKE